MKHAKESPFFGPNRYADCPVMEWLVELDQPESKSLQKHGDTHLQRLLKLLADCGLSEADTEALRGAYPDTPRARFAHLFAGTAIALQRYAGHAVGYMCCETPDDQPWLRVVYEFEEDLANVNAAALTRSLLAHVIPELDVDTGNPDLEFDPAASIEEYRTFASRTVMPADTRAIIRAAERADVPWLRLDRWPFPPARQTGRIREHSALLLGQGKYRHIVDGTLCVSRSATAGRLVSRRDNVLRFLAERGAPIRAYVQTESGLQPPSPLEGPPSLPFDSMAGKVLVANGEVLGFIHAAGEDEGEALHPSIGELACRAARDLDVGLLTLSVKSPDFSQPLETAGGVVEDLDIAPRLDRLLSAGSPLMDRAADGFIQWLYPPGSPSRIPIVAVTGTNGKTTTTRMIARIMQEAGYATGMACTNGYYIGPDRVQPSEDDDYIHRMRHMMIADTRIDAAVMEMYLGRMRTGGFPYDRCNVGVLTNVTADHLGPGRETVEQVADIKAAVLKRAGDGVVLNADDAQTGRLLPRLGAVRLAFSGRGEKALNRWLEHQPEALCVGLAEQRGQERIVIREGGRRHDLMAVGDIPATLDGAARFNVENALQAVAAGCLMGVAHDVIRNALNGFDNRFDNTPGRINVFEGLPYQLILDYAHNADGMRRLCEFTDTLVVEGRRILMFSIHGDRTDPEIEAMARAATGHFDVFVCRSNPDLRGRQPGEMATVLRDLLLEAGVAEDCVTACDDPVAAIEVTLGKAAPGDLLVMTHTRNEALRFWERFEAERTALQSPELKDDPPSASGS